MQVVFTDFVQQGYDVEERLLKEAGLSLTVAEPHCASEEDVIRAAQGATALLVQNAPVGARALSALPDLRIVSVPGIGVDAIDLAAAQKHGVWVANVPDGNVTEVASHALAMALSIVRRLPFYDRSVRAGAWNYEAGGPMTRPGKMTFGLVGMGRIGRLTADYAAPLFGRLVGYDPHLPDAAWPEGVERIADLGALFEASDVVSLHMPLTAETRGLVGAELLGRMKPGSHLVNVSRGPILDIGALLAALDSGQLAAAALDVLPEEPPAADHPVLAHPKLVLSPHAAFYSLESDEELRRRSVTNIIAFLETGRPENVVVEGRR